MKVGYETNKIVLSIAEVILFILTLSLIGCSKKSNNSNPVAPTGTSNTNQVVMQNASYVPQNITVSKGTIVTWTNKDSFDHTVTSGTPGHPSGLFDSGNIGPNGTYSYTFDSTGTYAYYCKIHLDKMTGTVTVK